LETVDHVRDIEHATIVEICSVRTLHEASGEEIGEYEDKITDVDHFVEVCVPAIELRLGALVWNTIQISVSAHSRSDVATVQNSVGITIRVSAGELTGVNQSIHVAVRSARCDIAAIESAIGVTVGCGSSGEFTTIDLSIAVAIGRGPCRDFAAVDGAIHIAISCSACQELTTVDLSIAVAVCTACEVATVDDPIAIAVWCSRSELTAVGLTV